ncbi:MAG: AbrB/MazE/SpoVT family DNA-binding domain-containing protein [Spirochaetes bacterium]|nr:AbrB/MazE/SpoVT family DNA-binding domain-containing protein [Spirochaetota bacterium]
MNTVTLSTKYQLVIPKEVRNRLGIEVGQKFQIIEYGDRIELVPVKEMKALRGFVKGITTSVKRERERI